MHMQDGTVGGAGPTLSPPWTGHGRVVDRDNTIAGRRSAGQRARARRPDGPAALSPGLVGPGLRECRPVPVGADRRGRGRRPPSSRWGRGARRGEGPCLEAIHAEARIQITDTAAAEQRWPRWTDAARQRGIGSLLCRSCSPGTARQRRRAVRRVRLGRPAPGGLFASHAAVTLFGAQHVGHLNRALESRDEIGQAKGILMERFSLNADQAFDLLVRSSQDTDVKLVDVARWLTQQAGNRDH
jgi:hypothetical protein